MLHERLTEDQTDWGLNPLEYQSREIARLHERNRLRSLIARARARDDKGHFIKATLNDPEIGVVFMTAHGPAYQVRHVEAASPITLPFVSILGEATA